MITTTAPAPSLPSSIRATVTRPGRLWSGARAALASIALGLAAISAQAEPLLLAPSYKAEGKNPDVSSYTGTLTVKIISDTTYTVEWKIGSSVIKGFGMRMADTLSATYMLQGQPGLIIYKVQEDGTLSGIWAIKGESGTGSETLTPR